MLQDQQDIAYVNEVDQRLQGLLSTTDVPIVVDIHTEPNSQTVLEEGLGYPLAVEFGSVLFHKNSSRGGPSAPGPMLLRGARFHWYEFKHPMDQRLTDEAWQARLKEGKAVKSLSLQLLQAPGGETRAQAAPGQTAFIIIDCQRRINIDSYPLPLSPQRGLNGDEGPSEEYVR